MAEAEGPKGPRPRLVGGGGGEGAPRGLLGGRPGVQMWGRFLVHHYAGRTGRGPRNFPSKHPPWGVHGHISFDRSALGLSLQDPKGPSAGLGWLAGLSSTLLTEGLPRGQAWPAGPGEGGRKLGPVSGSPLRRPHRPWSSMVPHHTSALGCPWV